MPRLRVTDRDGNTSEVPVQDGMIIGRGADAAVITLARTASRHHAQIRASGDGWAIEDLGGAGGTLVNGEPVQTATLSHGDRVQIPGLDIEFCGDTALAEGESLEDSTVTAADGSSALVRSSAKSGEHTKAELVKSLPDRDRADLALGTIEQVLSAIEVAHTPEDLLERLAQALLATHPACDRCHVLLCENDQLVPAASDSRVLTLLDERAFSTTAVRQSIEQKQALLCESTPSDVTLGAAASVTKQGIKSFVCAPMLRQGEPFGVIYLDSLRSEQGFTEDTPRVVDVVGSHAVKILDSMELLRTQAKLEADLKIVEQVQRRMLPRVWPDAPGFEFAASYEPCDQTGGDYYDFIRLDDGQ